MMIDQRLFALLIASIFTLSGALALAEAPKKEREGGVIGTGIVGTVTELGSIIVNGQRVTFAQNTMAASVLGGQRAAELTPGDTVVVVAEAMPQDWRAASIEQHYALVGPVVLANGTITVLGTSVDLSGATDQTQELAPSLSDGDWVAVSGLWREDVLIASKLVRTDGHKIAVVSGSYVPNQTDAAFMIGSSEVSGLDLNHVEVGQIVTVTGQPLLGGIAAETVRIGLFSGPMDRVIAQGFMSKPTTDGLYTILGSGAVSFTDQPQMIDTETVGIYCIAHDANGQASMAPLGAACE